MEQPHPLVLAYQETILGFEPPAYARMNGRGASYKYAKVVRDVEGKRVYPPLTLDTLQAHLRGSQTVAACLIDPEGQARVSALDIDNGGEEVLRRVLEMAAIQGFTGFAQSSVNEQHQGGHVWFLFRERTDPQRLRRLAQQLASQVGISAETYPTRKAIRLPLGIHRWTGKRGTLLLSSGLALNLDAGQHVVRQAVRILRDLPQNAASLLPPLPQRGLRNEAAVSLPEAVGGTREVINQYNQQTNLISLLESFGGRVAQPLAHSGVLMHCPCPHHKHGDEKPSLEIKPARNRARYGEYVAFGYSPSCLFYTESGTVMDSFGVWCLINGLSFVEAVKKLTTNI